MILYKRKSESALKDKETAATEMNRAISLKENLETLCRYELTDSSEQVLGRVPSTVCRELQRQNKVVMEGSRNVAEMEQTKRQELSEKFQSTISDVSERLDEQGKDRINQLQENEKCNDMLTLKLQTEL